MTASAGFTIGLRWRGFGYYGDALLPEMRMGFVAIWWCRGALREHVDAYRQQARAALRSLGL